MSEVIQRAMALYELPACWFAKCLKHVLSSESDIGGLAQGCLQGKQCSCNQQAFLACEGKQLERFKQASSIEESKSQPQTSKLPPVESCQSSALHFVRSNQRPGAAEHA
jgi:hypothetical protein